jgi:hypothetical protein
MKIYCYVETSGTKKNTRKIVVLAALYDHKLTYFYACTIKPYEILQAKTAGKR